MTTSASSLMKARLRRCGLWLLGCWVAGLSWAGAATGPMLEILLPGQTVPSSQPEVIAWGWNDDGQATVPADLRNVVAISAGERHTVALQQDGTVVVWGSDKWGQKTVPTGLTGVTAISAGGNHTVALKQDGTVVAWGKNVDAQTTVPAGLSGVVAVSAGYKHTVALKQDGSVVAWGSNAFGQTDVPAVLSGVVAISAGIDHTVALKHNGTVVAWGYRTSSQNVPLGGSVMPAGLGGVVAIAAGGAHTVALKQDGTVVSWGYALDAAYVPLGLIDVVSIAAGDRHTVALKRNGQVVTWGHTYFGASTMPKGLSGVAAISAGVSHTVALTRGIEFGIPSASTPNERSVTLRSSGSIDVTSLSATIYGADEASFTLAGTPLPTSLPVGSSAGLLIRFSPLHMGKHSAILRITSSDPNTSPYDLALTGTGNTAPAPDLEVRDASKQAVRNPSVGKKVIAWGFFGYGDTAVPADLTGVEAISAGSVHVLALKQDGTVVAWGDQQHDQIKVPAGLSGVISVAAGGNYSVALKQNGIVVAWGDHYLEYGQTLVPAGLTDVTAIAAGLYHAVALKGNGKVVAWGFNIDGETNVPVGLSGVAAIAAGDRHTVALKRDGSVVAWGVRYSDAAHVPKDLRGVVAISAGGDHTVALKQDGSIVAWGYNGHGQTSVPAGLSGVEAIAAGGNHTVALKQDGTIVTWGYNGYGQTSIPATLSGVVAIAASTFNTVALVEAPGDFGGKHLGTAREHRLNLVNIGTAPLQMSVEIEGPDADQFSLTSPVPAVIVSNNSSEASCSFKPTRIGPLHAKLKITSNSPFEPVYTLDLIGIGLYASNAPSKPGAKGRDLIPGPLVADRATGAIMQKITFANPTGAALNGLRLIISNLAPGITVQSSSATHKVGTVEVIYSKPIGKGETVSLTLTYHDPLRRTNLQPIIHAESLAEPEPREGPGDGVLVPILSMRDTANGPVLQWNAVAKKTYVVEYSDDAGKTWYSAVHRLVAGSSRLLWTDRGQPETWDKPVNKAGRLYRVKSDK